MRGTLWALGFSGGPPGQEGLGRVSVGTGIPCWVTSVAHPPGRQHANHKPPPRVPLRCGSQDASHRGSQTKDGFVSRSEDSRVLTLEARRAGRGGYVQHLLVLCAATHSAASAHDDGLNRRPDVGTRQLDLHATSGSALAGRIMTGAWGRRRLQGPPPSFRPAAGSDVLTGCLGGRCWRGFGRQSGAQEGLDSR